MISLNLSIGLGVAGRSFHVVHFSAESHSFGMGFYRGLLFRGRTRCRFQQLRKVLQAPAHRTLNSDGASMQNFMDELEPWLFSFAKNAVAFLKCLYRS